MNLHSHLEEKVGGHYHTKRGMMLVIQFALYLYENSTTRSQFL